MSAQTDHRISKWERIIVLLGFSLIFCAMPLFSQIPDQFKNLQVLPQEIGKRELLDTMKKFTNALGVRCQFCHIGEEGKPLTTFDFVSDEKPTKQTARVMIRMVRVINTEHLTKVANKSANSVQVSCMTCHHGENRPARTLEDILAEVISTRGVQEAIQEYKSLREKYYGGFTYDFRDSVLNRLAQRLDGAGKSDDAIVILKVNAQVNPNSAMAYFFLGEIYLAKGEKALALENYKKTLSLEPDNPFAKQKIDELNKP